MVSHKILFWNNINVTTSNGSDWSEQPAIYQVEWDAHDSNDYKWGTGLDVAPLISNFRRVNATQTIDNEVRHSSIVWIAFNAKVRHKSDVIVIHIKNHDSDDNYNYIFSNLSMLHPRCKWGYQQPVPSLLPLLPYANDQQVKGPWPLGTRLMSPVPIMMVSVFLWCFWTYMK
jgi:hypothetical protein